MGRRTGGSSRIKMATLPGTRENRLRGGEKRDEEMEKGAERGWEMF